jgi:hypothetical protein
MQSKPCAVARLVMRRSSTELSPLPRYSGSSAVTTALNVVGSPPCPLLKTQSIPRGSAKPSQRTGTVHA